MIHTCPSGNTQTTDQTSFWSAGNLHWDEHRIGWAIAGGCAVLVSPVFRPLPSFSTGVTTPVDSAYLSCYNLATLSVRSWSLFSFANIDVSVTSNYNKPNEQRQV